MTNVLPSTGRQIINGLQRSFPIILSYIPVGFTYGVLAHKAGISDINVILMSMLVFAGSGQFIAVGMMAGGAGALAVILTTFVVNLRHLLMAASLSPWMAQWSRPLLVLFSADITDETFAMNSAKAVELNDCKAEALSLNITAHSSWVLGGALGALASGLISDVRPLGLDFALAGMFIGLIVLQVDSTVKVLTAICAGILGTVLYACGLQEFYIIIATVVAATFGLGVELWIKR
ncbi:AzlC family ABC transporter permease [Desulforhopalus vacuolatus]|uniref:AzlC family ABC transporter permease n=1 Tax=Desulforhopalus vacuolatus TaxID=40414 RepID=UPI0019650190|nr:AzlC family ABC transporter permease [Desulforhopalus vacuolatus]MBM9520096.1 AzlC family ABC transporter permease [Desulforhopalus vacuolatus]